MRNDSDGHALMEQAKKKLTPGLFGKLFSSNESRMEEALDLYQAAANVFKMQKQWNDAGIAYEECGNIETKLGSDSAAVHFQDAAHCFNFVDKMRGKKNLEKSIQIYEKKGKFQQAGKITQNMANELEVDLEYAEAIKKYKQAAEYYSMENQNTRSLEQSCLIKVADLMCISDHADMLKETPKIYEKIGMQYLTVPLMKSSAKDYFFKCVVVYLVHRDEVSANICLNKFLSEDPTFSETKEELFLKNAIASVSDPPNPEEFKKAVSIYKTYRDLDKWKLNMFAAILKKLEGDEDDMK